MLNDGQIDVEGGAMRLLVAAATTTPLNQK